MSSPKKVRTPIPMSVLLLVGLCGGADEPPINKLSLSAEQFTRKTIYHSPQTPGYTCWVGAWQMPDQSLMVSF